MMEWYNLYSWCYF